jgi:p-methyltransferase
VDCLIIGFHEIDLKRIVNDYEIMKKHTGAYLHLLHAIVRFRGEWAHYTYIFNAVLSEVMGKPVHLNLMRMPNLAVCYLKSFLVRRKFDVEIINFCNVEKELFEELLRHNPTAVAITTTYYVSDAPVVELIRYVRKISPDTIIILGGPFIHNICLSSADSMTEDYIFEKMGADIYINSFQGELTLARTLAELRKGKERRLLDVPNLTFRPDLQRETARESLERSGCQKAQYQQFIRTSLELEDNDLNTNCIDWSLFPISFYTPTAFMRTARGCPFECAFCNFPSMAGKLTYSSLDIIEKEMKQLSKAGVRYLIFIDDSFNVPLSRFKEILRMMISCNFKFQWFSYFKCSHADDETFDLMQKSGCRGVFLGIESGDQEMLDNMNKKVKVEQYKTGIRKLHECGIFTFVSIIIGFPGETEKSVQNTITFMEETQPTFFKTELYFHADHVPIHKQASKYSLKGKGYGWSHKTMSWQTACDHIDKMYRTVQGSQVCPVYMFDFWTIPYFLSKGISLEQIKKFLSICKPLLLRNFNLSEIEDEEKAYLLLDELGKEIVANFDNL